VLVYRILSHTQNPSPIRCGAPLGQADIKPLVHEIERRKVADLLIDFSGIDAINGSYSRAILGWLIRCATARRSGLRLRRRLDDPWAVRPLPIERIFVHNLAPDVREEIDGLLCQPGIRLPCLEAVTIGSDRVSQARLLGHLDRQLRECLARLYAIGGEGTTLDLHARYSGDEVKITAWNNRLAALYDRLLVDRRKDGRTWIYTTVTQHLKSYGI